MSFTISKSRKKRTRAASAAKKEIRPRALPLRALFSAIALGAVIVALLLSGSTIYYTNLVTGQLAPATVVAETSFGCNDLAATQLKKEKASEDVLPVFAINYDALSDAERAINLICDRLNALYQDITTTTGQVSKIQLTSLNDALNILNLPISPQEIQNLIPSNNVSTARRSLLKHLANTWDIGILSTKERSANFSRYREKDRIRLITKNSPNGKRITLNTLLNPELAIARTMRQIGNDLPPLRAHPNTLQTLLAKWINNNLRYEATQTQAQRNAAQEQITPVIKTIREGSTLTEAGKSITEQMLEELLAHKEAISHAQTPAEALRIVMVHIGFMAAALFVFLGLLHLLRPDLLRHPSNIFLATSLTLLVLLAGKGLLYLAATQQSLLSQGAISFLIPIALAPLLATILIGPLFALATGIFTCACVAFMLDFSFTVFLQGLVASITAVIMTRGAHRRSNIFRAGLIIGIAQLLTAISISVLDQVAWDFTLIQTATAFAGGLTVAAISLLILPLFEYLFGITTDLRLLELSDMTHPLLQRLAHEAPGTYHHSLMVANLSQAATKKIGGNELLVRVCAYYHDIGKLSKPEFFIENIHGQNPHDELSPSMSTLVVISHVKEGVSLAARYKLPQLIIDGIEQHHGTSKIAYFYHRACQLAENDSALNKPKTEDFRYPGPRPTTKEMGILLLADSIEAASRSIDKPSPSNIQNLVEDIVTAKLNDHQLDHCDLTFTQLAAIKQSFIFSLNNMLHGRVPYPKDEDRNTEPTNTSDTQTGTTNDLQPMAHGTST